jgi:hypothetical protein
METITKNNANELKVEIAREPITNTFSFEEIVKRKAYWDNLYDKAMELELKTKEELEIKE